MPNFSYQNIDDCISALDKNEIVGTLFLDLSMAFDLVNHDNLLQKLSMYGLRAQGFCPRLDYIFDLHQ